jgi:hypothetical protein
MVRLPTRCRRAAPGATHHLQQRPGALLDADAAGAFVAAIVALLPPRPARLAGLLFGVGDGLFQRRDRRRQGSQLDDPLRRGLPADEAQHLVADRIHHDQIAVGLGLESVHRAFFSPARQGP